LKDEIQKKKSISKKDKKAIKKIEMKFDIKIKLCKSPEPIQVSLVNPRPGL